MSIWHTRIPRDGELSRKASPSLIFLKWHGYERKDGNEFSRHSRSDYLSEVARAVNRASKKTEYSAFFKLYLDTIRALRSSVTRIDEFEASSVWRIVCGFGSNPALETGISLHHLLGVPYLPGSAVKGLAHHEAEASLIEKYFGYQETDAAPEPPPGELLERFLDEARFIRTVFGSLNLERPNEKTENGSRSFGPHTPKSILRSWRQKETIPEALETKVASLLDDGDNVGALVTFFDAFPPAGQKDILELDILNPHYPDFYLNGEAPPSDDQNPNPVFFLALRSGTRIQFPFLISLSAPQEPRKEWEAERLDALCGCAQADLIRQIRCWLTDALSRAGIGAKTAAGYGYFCQET